MFIVVGWGKWKLIYLLKFFLYSVSLLTIRNFRTSERHHVGFNFYRLNKHPLKNFMFWVFSFVQKLFSNIYSMEKTINVWYEFTETPALRLQNYSNDSNSKFSSNIINYGVQFKKIMAQIRFFPVAVDQSGCNEINPGLAATEALHRMQTVYCVCVFLSFHLKKQRSLIKCGLRLQYTNSNPYDDRCK